MHVGSYNIHVHRLNSETQLSDFRLFVPQVVQESYILLDPHSHDYLNANLDMHAIKPLYRLILSDIKFFNNTIYVGKPL